MNFTNWKVIFWSYFLVQLDISSCILRTYLKFTLNVQVCFSIFLLLNAFVSLFLMGRKNKLQSEYSLSHQASQDCPIIFVIVLLSNRSIAIVLLMERVFCICFPPYFMCLVVQMHVLIRHLVRPVV